jgi:CubicO group peptidase (beta-lactamase class C family)
MIKLFLIMIMGVLSSCSKENIMENNLMKIDQIFSDYNSLGMPGAAVMIIQDGTPILQKGFGMADLKQGLPVTPKTNFRLASITKQFTAMSILQLVERGNLSLDTTLLDIFSEFPDYGKIITIKDLLHHTSGLYDYEGLEPKGQVRQLKDKDVLTSMMSMEGAYFPAGEKHRYSNTAYAALTQIIEKETGITFGNYLKNNIFDPLDMDNTLAYENGINEVSNRAYGYTIEESGVRLTDQNKYSAVLGDGGIYSNLEDLYRWDQSLYTYQLLGQQYLDAAFSNHKTSRGKLMNYGYGWRIENYKNMDILYHTGSSIGFRNIIYRIPSKNFTVVILTNRDAGGEFSKLTAAHKIIDIFF